MAADQAQQGEVVQVRLLGPFSVVSGGRAAGPWPRPSARRLCQLVLVSPGRRVSRELACEDLFPGLDPRAAARAVSKALSMARATLAELGQPAASLLAADLSHIWASPGADVDAEIHERALRAALAMNPGHDRDARLAAALAEEGELLADEPYADWALGPRERLEALRQEARLALARDRSRGAGLSRPEAVLAAWEAYFEHDPASEEAAGALVQAYFAHGHRELAVRAHERCRSALDELGLKVSPWLEETYAAAAAESAPAVPPPAREELRTVTVVAAEVATPAGLARELGPEGLRDVVGRCLAVVIAEVEALGGTVTSVSGTGLQAIFGAPEAHEDDPERAVRAAYRALEAVASDATGNGATPALRVGVETGPAVLGPIGGGARVEYGAVGEVVGLAAALQSRARPGSALVGPVTRAATEHLFTWGTREPQDAATYLGHPRPRAPGRRPRLGGRGPLVGRQAEMAVLDTALAEAAGGRGSIVLLTGEPGLGKTRLVQESRRRAPKGTAKATTTQATTTQATTTQATTTQATTTQATAAKATLWLEGRCASYASSTPYGLYAQLLAGWAGVTPDQPEAVVRPALERVLASVRGADDLFPLLARMMGLSTGATLGRMGPGELQRATFGAWHQVMSGLLARGPVVLVLEDLHWADPTSLRLTLQLARLAAGHRLLVLATSRPEADLADLERALAAGPPVHRILLERLPGAAQHELARSLMGEAADPKAADSKAADPKAADPKAAGPAAPAPAVMDAVLSNVDGNPLFLEERLASLLETRALVRDQGRWRLRPTPGPQDPQVPQALDRLVRARVDRLSPAARDAVRPASVLGAEFPLSLLTAVVAAEQPLVPALDELIHKDLLHEVTSQPEPVYRFRHALIQEATYNGLLRAERRLLHGRAAWALEAASSGRTSEMARHFAAAGETARALAYFELAGDHATAAFANDEAISSYRAAMAIVHEQTMTDAEVALRAKLANVLWRTGRREQARAAFTEALRFAGDGDPLLRVHLLTRLGRLEAADHRFEAAIAAFDAAGPLLGENPAAGDAATVEEWLELKVDGWACVYAMRNEPEPALAMLHEIRPVLEASGSAARRYGFYNHLAMARVQQNGYRVDEAALADARQALAAAEQGDEEKDAGYATFFLGRFLWLHGDLDEAREHMERALAMAERIGETMLLGLSLLGLALTALRRHDASAVRALIPRIMAEAEGMANTEYLAGAKACLAWLAWQDHRPDEVITLSAEIAELLATDVDAGFYHGSIQLWVLIAAHLDLGHPAEAAAVARELLRLTTDQLPADLTAALQADNFAIALTLAQKRNYF